MSVVAGIGTGDPRVFDCRTSAGVVGMVEVVGVTCDVTVRNSSGRNSVTRQRS